MENFDPNLAHQMATKQIKMTFQQWGYKGTAIYTIGGNTNGADILQDIAEMLQDDPLEILLDDHSCKKDFPFTALATDNEGRDWFQVVFKDDDGNTCEVEDYSDEIPSMLVSLEIVDVKKEEPDD